MSTIETVLTYVGTVLIAIEFVRKFTDLQALIAMVVAWPVSTFLNSNNSKDILEKLKKNRINTLARIMVSFFFAIITIPLDLIFYLIWFLVLILNSFHKWVNRLNFEGKKRVRPVSNMMASQIADNYRKHGNKKAARAVEDNLLKELEKREIPVLPIMGLILISIAFVWHFI